MSPFGAFEGRANLDFHRLSQRILQGANRPVPRAAFVREILEALAEGAGCDAAQLRLWASGKVWDGEVCRLHPGSFRFRASSTAEEDAPRFPWLRGPLEQTGPMGALSRSTRGSLWTGDLAAVLSSASVPAYLPVFARTCEGERCPSLALLPLRAGDEPAGLLVLKSRRPGCFDPRSVEFLEGLAPILVAALAGQRAQETLRERVKELTCLHRIAQLADRGALPLEELLSGIAALLPAAWQYPEVATARIVLDGRDYAKAGFSEGVDTQRAEIVVQGDRRGHVEVAYAAKQETLDEGPFLKEERSLINTVAAEIGLIIERKQIRDERARLEEQLRHADRLATIGQLAAGVAHELNEPLGGILGFAQLAMKGRGVPGETASDLEKIVRAALHAREVVRKLMLFSRQIPPRKARVDLNQLVKEGLYFLESRCAKANIELARLLAPKLPAVLGDGSQLHQVLVNLVVNAIQAMPDGGRLVVETRHADGRVMLTVMDTGTGMTEEVKRRIFTPFFTTKEVGQGTGLGLAVVHGIVRSHGGSIRVESVLGRGSRFEVHLPAAGEGGPAQES